MYPAWGLFFSALKRATISRWLYQNRKIRPFFLKGSIIQSARQLFQKANQKNHIHDYYTFEYARSMLSTSNCLSATALQQSPHVTFKDAALISTSEKQIDHICYLPCKKQQRRKSDFSFIFLSRLPFLVSSQSSKNILHLSKDVKVTNHQKLGLLKITAGEKNIQSENINSKQNSLLPQPHEHL